MVQRPSMASEPGVPDIAQDALSPRDFSDAPAPSFAETPLVPAEATAAGDMPDDELDPAIDEADVSIAPSEDLPTLVLVTAGIAVFDAVAVLGFLATMALQPARMLALFQAVAGVALAAGIAPIILGAVILQRNRESGMQMPGTPWAPFAVLIGILLSLLVLAIPLVSALMAFMR